VLAESGIKIRLNRGGRPNRKRELLEQAAREIVLEVAEGISCSYRPLSYGTSGSLQPPACGQPVRFVGDKDPLCDFHQSAAKDYRLTAETLAARQRETLTQSCAKCGESWETTLLRAKAVWEAHRRHCSARAPETRFDHDEAVRLYVEEELTLRAVGEQLGVTESAVWVVLRDRGIPRRSVGQRPGSVPPNRKFNPDEAIRLYAEGLSCQAIAERLDLASASSVHAALRRRGIEMRPPGWSDATRARRWLNAAAA